MPGYQLLAQYWDKLFTGHVPAYTRARKKLLRHVMPGVRTACDLACGTGTTALALARRGVRVYGVDASPVMIRLARRKARRVAPRRRPVFLVGDLRTFRLPERVDLALCEGDAVNHLPKRSDLRRAFRAASRGLRPGGWFFFDVNHRRAYEQLWPGVRERRARGVRLVMSCTYDRRTRRALVVTEWEIRRGRGTIRRRERLERVWWTRAEVRRALRHCGFDHIRVWDAAPMLGAALRVAPGSRSFFLARKVA